MNVPKGYVKVPKDKLLSEYVKYIRRASATIRYCTMRSLHA